MKTQTTNFQKLLEEATVLYKSEKSVTEILTSLGATPSADTGLNEGIAREAEENKRHCARLEGFLAVADQVAAANTEDQTMVCDLSLMLKRIATKHARFGYETAIFLAGSKGEHELAKQLRHVLLSGYKPSSS